MPPPLPITDPHFHLWDVTALPNPNLGELATVVPSYTLLNYEEDCGVGVGGSVWIESIVGQAPGGAVLDPVAETRFVLEHLGAEGRKNINLVVFVKLSALPEAQAVLDAHRHVAGDRLVGVRMILNYSAKDPTLTWPQVESGEFLTGGVPSFRDGFALLDKYKLSFDLQVNWFQVKDAAAFLENFPETVVVLDHLGCLKLGVSPEEDAKRTAVWTEGMQALAARPTVYVKLSMLEYLRAGWQEAGSEANAVVKARVREVIEWFGADRCMFASNFPVDKYMGNKTSLEALFTAQHALVADLPHEQQRALFSGTAKKVYKLK